MLRADEATLSSNSTHPRGLHSAELPRSWMLQGARVWVSRRVKERGRTRPRGCCPFERRRAPPCGRWQTILHWAVGWAAPPAPPWRGGSGWVRVPVGLTAIRRWHLAAALPRDGEDPSIGTSGSVAGGALHEERDGDVICICIYRMRPAVPWRSEHDNQSTPPHPPSWGVSLASC